MGNKLIVWANTSPKALKSTIGHVIANAQAPHKVVGFYPDNDEFPETQPGDVILACGDKVAKYLAKHKLVPSNRTITSLRGNPVDLGNGSHIFLTYDPKITELDYSKVSQIIWDTQLAIRYLKTGSVNPELGVYQYVDTFDEIVEEIQERYKETGQRVPVCPDLETVGLDEYDPDAFIVSISLTIDPGMAHVMRFNSKEHCPGFKDVGDIRWQQIDGILNSEMTIIRGANYKYDCRWMRKKWGIENESYRFDTTLVGSLLDENRSNSLNTHAKVYSNIGGYDDPFNKKFDKSRMDLVPDDDLLVYAGGDTDAGYQVADALRQELLQDKRLANFYVKLLQPATRAFEDMEHEGILIDVDYYAELREKLVLKINELEEAVWKLFPKRLLYKHAGKLMLTRRDLIKEYMFGPLGLDLKPIKYTSKAKSESWEYAATDKKHLAMFSEHPKAKPFIDALNEFNATKKTLGTYVDGFLTFLRSDGRFHPSFIQFKGEYSDQGGGEGGTNTGRTAAKDPAVQTIPKHTIWAKPLRKGYIPPPGFIIVNWDYSQGELRIAACLADEKNMIQAYKDGIDLHLKTGAGLNGYTLEEALAMKAANDPAIKAIRQGGKAGNFGLLYGMGAMGFQIYARDTYGVHLTMEQAEAARDNFFMLYPGLVSWHTKYQKAAQMHGHIRSPLGRVRHLPLVNSPDKEAVKLSLRQAINAPVQSTLSDLSQYAMVQFKAKHGRPQGCRMFLFTHDALTAYVDEQEASFWIPEVATIMETLPLQKEFGWTPQLTFLADAERGANLAELEEVERSW